MAWQDIRNRLAKEIRGTIGKDMEDGADLEADAIMEAIEDAVTLLVKRKALKEGVPSYQRPEDPVEPVPEFKPGDLVVTESSNTVQQVLRKEAGSSAYHLQTQRLVGQDRKFAELDADCGGSWMRVEGSQLSPVPAAEFQGIQLGDVLQTVDGRVRVIGLCYVHPRGGTHFPSLELCSENGSVTDSSLWWLVKHASPVINTRTGQQLLRRPKVCKPLPAALRLTEPQENKPNDQAPAARETAEIPEKVEESAEEPIPLWTPMRADLELGRVSWQIRSPNFPALTNHRLELIHRGMHCDSIATDAGMSTFDCSMPVGQFTQQLYEYMVRWDRVHEKAGGSCARKCRSSCSEVKLKLLEVDRPLITRKIRQVQAELAALLRGFRELQDELDEDLDLDLPEEG